MRNEESDIFDALEEQDFEHEWVDDVVDLEYESEEGALDDEDAFDEYGAYFDYDS